MADQFRQVPGRLAQRGFRAAFPLVRKLYYDVANQFGFGDLYTHEMMLADRVRVDAYQAAIERYVHEGDVVIDLGTGTGILAFLAASRRPARVYAVDHSPTILDLARKVRDANGLGRVELLKVNSRKLELTEKADVIIQEQMGHALFDEQMVRNVSDLRDRLLKPGGRILPSRFELFLDPVQLKDEFAVPFAWEQRLHGVDFSVLADLRPSVAPDYLFKLVNQHEYDHFLTASEPVLTFDLDTVDERELAREFLVRRRVTTAGRLDGVCVHFTARFDDEISISTSPFAARTCWKVPYLRVEARHYEVGEELAFRVQAPDLANMRTWQWQVVDAKGATGA
jgi:protein arginine N-methyltransferase 1